MLDLEFAQVTDTGRVRDRNEDYLGYVLPASPAQARTHGWLFALADGVGGHDQGEVASRLAVEHVLAGFRAALAGEAHGPLLSRLIQSANAHVFETGMSSRPARASMATTLVACSLRFDRATVAHVGDSRCYLLRGGRVAAVTRDHTVVNEQVRIGVITGREAGDTMRHVLSRSVGSDLFVGVECTDYQLQLGDVLLLCSDGLHGAVRGEEMAHIIAHCADLNAAAHQLVAIANDRDGADNVSVQIVRIRGVERMGMYRGRPYKLQ